MKLTQNLIIMNEEIARLIKEQYDKEPDTNPDDILMAMMTHGFFQCCEQYRLISPNGEFSLEELADKAIDMVCQIINYKLKKEEMSSEG